MVRRRRLHRFVEVKRVREAILKAEESTDAPIFVSISPYFWGNVRRTAERVFRKHGLDNTVNRNAIFFFVVPSRRQFAIIGDAGAHEKLGQSTWNAIVEIMQSHFARGNATAALVQGIQDIARELARHYPRKQGD